MGTDGRVQEFNPCLERWLEGWPRRGEILGRVRSLLEPSQEAKPVAGLDRAGGPAVWLLRRGMAGIVLGAGNTFPQDVQERLREIEPVWAGSEPHATIERLCRILARGRDDVTRSMSKWLALASATGAIPDRWAEGLRTPGSRWPRPVGDVARASLTTTLRYRTVRHIPRRPVSTPRQT